MKATALSRLQWRLSVLAAVACYLLIVLGTVVRVTGSGEGCPGWPLCYGVVPYWRLHSVIEYAHRALADTVALLVVLTATIVWRGDHRLPRALIMATLAVALLVIQIVLGGVTVLTHLSWPLVALHLATALALLGALITLTLLLRPERELDRQGCGQPQHVVAPRQLDVPVRLAFGATGLLVLTYVTAIAGALVVGTESDLACNAWPACSTRAFFPQTGTQVLNFAHRLCVVLLAVVVALVLAQIRSLRGRHRAIWLAAWGVTATLAIQALVGALTIWLNAPPLWEGIHVGGAATVWAAAVVLAVLVAQARAASAMSRGRGAGTLPPLAILPPDATSDRSVDARRGG